ncbi:MAG: alpha/beta hydrolase [Rhizobiaceae bacterium]|nr:alpha/beta hydrolase [Rhizobiaceae bacterium]
MREAKLLDTDYNPVPEGCKSGYVTTPDGMDIRYANWKSLSYPVKGTVLLLHGRAEFIEKMFETVTDLRQNGFDVLTFDWRGQGGSSRLLEDSRRGYIDNFDQYALDLESIMDDVALPDCKAPFYVLAHSSGALVALNSAPQFANRIRRMVLASPFVGLAESKISPGAMKAIAGTFCAIGLGEMYMAGRGTANASRPFSANILTSSTARYERNAKLVADRKSLSIGGPTASWLFAASRAIDQVNDPDFHSQISTPILMISAGNDQVVSNRAIEDLGRRLRSGSATCINGAKHEILQERDVFREQLLAAFYSFVPGSELDA